MDYQEKLQPVAWEKMTFSIPLYGQNDGKGFLLSANPFNEMAESSISRHKRQLPIKLWRGFIDTDSISLVFPHGFKLVFELSTQQIKTDFGHYDLHFLKSNTGVTCIRTLRIHAGEFPADRYEEYILFKQDIRAMDELALKIEPN